MEVNNKNGFTLIELLVVTSIIVLMSGLSLAYYNDFTNTKNLNNEQEKVDEALELAQKKAITGDLSPASGCVNFVGYSLDIIPSSSTYKLNFCCNPNPLNTKDDADATCVSNNVATYILSNNVTFVAPAVNAKIRFKKLGTGVGLTTNNGNGVYDGGIILKSPGSNKCASVTVSSSGVITDFPVTACP